MESQQDPNRIPTQPTHTLPLPNSIRRHGTLHVPSSFEGLAGISIPQRFPNGQTTHSQWVKTDAKRQPFPICPIKIQNPVGASKRHVGMYARSNTKVGFERKVLESFSCVAPCQPPEGDGFLL